MKNCIFYVNEGLSDLMNDNLLNVSASPYILAMFFERLMLNYCKMAHFHKMRSRMKEYFKNVMLLNTYMA